MKLKFAISIALSVFFGISSIPAEAFGIDFNVYDHNHDGRWDRRDYYNAYRAYHLHHDRVYLPRAEVYRRFDQCDVNHDGYLTPVEVREIHTW
jgi:Ca2+-binding EF-hand superfamily protein